MAHTICERIKAARQLTLLEFESGAGSMMREVPLTTAIVQGIVDGVIAEVGELGGDGGVIVASPSGPPVFAMNTPGMYRGRATSDGLSKVAIFADE